MMSLGAVIDKMSPTVFYRLAFLILPDRNVFYDLLQKGELRVTVDGFSDVLLGQLVVHALSCLASLCTHHGALLS